MRSGIVSLVAIPRCRSRQLKPYDHSNVVLPDRVLRVFIVFRWQTNDLTLSLSEAERERLRAVDIREAVILSEFAGLVHTAVPLHQG